MTIQNKAGWVKAKIDVALRMIDRAESANRNPRNSYSPERMRRIRKLQQFLCCANADLTYLRAGEDVEISAELYDLKNV